MTSRERILAAIEHRQPDRVPVDLGRVAVPGGVPLELVLCPLSPTNWRGVSIDAVLLKDVN